MLIFIFGCQFDSDEIYEPNIDKPPTTPTFSPYINLPNTDDVLLMYFSDEVQISLSNDSVYIFDINVYIDGKETWIDRRDTIFYTNLIFKDYEEHSLKVEVYTTSGSNSIMDNAGMEGYLFTSREITYKFAKLNDEENVQCQANNNGLKIWWKPFSSLTFESYIIEREETGLSFKTKEPNFVDEDYIGEETTYYIYVKSTTGSKYLWATLNTGKNFPKLKYKFINKRLALTWDSTINKSKIKEYGLYLSNKKLGVVSSDTNYFFPEDYRICELGGSYSFKVEAKPVYDYVYDEFAYEGNPYMQKCESPFGVPYNIPVGKIVANDSLIAIVENNDSLFYCNLSNESYGFITSIESNSYIITSDLDKLIVSRYLGNFDIYNLSNFTYEKSVQQSRYPKAYKISSIANNGVASMWVGEDSILVFNVFNEQYIGIVREDQIINTHCSLDGKCFIFFSPEQGYVYSLSNNSLVKTNTINYSNIGFDNMHSNMRQIVDNNEFFCLWHSVRNKMEFRSYSDLTLVNTHYIKISRFLSFDDNNERYMVVGNNSIIYIKDFNTGETIFELPLNWFYSPYNESGFFSNNTIYVNGLKYILNK